MTEHKAPHVLFVGGGTLGPVTPLLATAAAVRALAADASFSWIGTAAGPERTLVERAGIPFHAISSGKLRRYFSWENVTDLVRIKLGFFQAFFLLGRLRPDVVVSAGGFVAVPVAWAAWCRGIPVHLHQQDPIAGLANRLSLPCAASVSVALESSLADFAAKHPVWTGNPVRADILSGSREEAKRLFGLDDSAPTVLVLGGGTGAAGINDLVRGSLPTLLESAHVIHVVGRGKSAGLNDLPRYHEYELLTGEMAHAYAAADLVVCRAGMGTLTELAALGKPALVIPMPASHQEANARVFAKSGAAMTLDERHVTATRFALTVVGLLKDGARLAEASKAMLALNRPDAAQAVASLVLKTAWGRSRTRR